MGFKARSGSIITPHSALAMCVIDPPQSQLWISKPRPVPILHLGTVRLEWLRVTSQCHFWNNWAEARFKPRTSRPKALQTLYRLSYPGRLCWICFMWSCSVQLFECFRYVTSYCNHTVRKIAFNISNIYNHALKKRVLKPASGTQIYKGNNPNLQSNVLKIEN